MFALSCKATKPLLRQVISSIFVAVAAFAFAATPAQATINVTSYGANGSDTNNDTTAFQNALNAAGSSTDKDVFIPGGTYYVGSSAASVAIPAGVTLRGTTGANPLIILNWGTKRLFDMGNASHLKSINFECGPGSANTGNGDRGIVFMGSGGSGASVEYCTFNQSWNNDTIVTDHADNITVKNSTFMHVRIAILTQFSDQVTVMDNSIDDASQHGIEFWGNYNWVRDSTGIYCVRNTVTNVAGGGIWAAGCDVVTFDSNYVENAGDVGIDVEFTTNAHIGWNTVKKVKHGGISCFYSCNGVVIENNNITNNYTFQSGTEQLLAGIWLTGTDTGAYPGDTGHENITIKNNTITCDSSVLTRRTTVWVQGTTCKNVRLQTNTLTGAVKGFGWFSTSTMDFGGRSTLSDNIYIWNTGVTPI